MFAGVLLHRTRRTAIGITFTQNRIDGAAEALGISIADLAFGVGTRVLREVGDVVALGLEFFDGGHELRHRRADVGQLDDVGVRVLGQCAQFGQIVGHALLVGQVFRELRQHTCRNRDVAGFDVDPSCAGEGADDRQERVRRQHRRLVGQGVNDGRLLHVHVPLSSPVVRSGHDQWPEPYERYQYHLSRVVVPRHTLCR